MKNRYFPIALLGLAAFLVISGVYAESARPGAMTGASAGPVEWTAPERFEAILLDLVP